MARMDLDHVPRLVGDDAKSRFNQAFSVLSSTRWPLYLIGPSGSGKTVMAMVLAKAYALKYKVPAYYAQLSPDQTKTSLILGLRLVDGTLKPVRGMVAEAMEAGGVVIVDEATHTTQEMLLMFNSILDRTSVTSIGDEVIYAKDSFRMIFCSNNAIYAGNVRLPQSFAQRLVVFKYDYPSAEDEFCIAKQIVGSEYRGVMGVSDNVIRYIVSYMREVRTDYFPLSARNMAVAVIRLALLEREPVAGVDRYFEGANIESNRKQIAERIHGREIENAEELTGREVNEFLQFVSSVGVENFREAVLSSCMYYLDVDGSELDGDVIRNQVYNGVI